MNRSLTRPNAQAVLDLYGYSDRLQIASALNEDRRRHRVGETIRALADRLHRTRPARAASTTCATC
jgi:hypothetical protein